MAPAQAPNRTPSYPDPEHKALLNDMGDKEVQEKAGLIPNMSLGFARRPAEWCAFFVYHDALMNSGSDARTSNLTKVPRDDRHH